MRSYENKFRDEILVWGSNNLKEFLWRKNITPYKVLISEILLQQTNSRTVKKIYREFIENFPTIESINKAEVDEIGDIIDPIGLHYKKFRIKNICQKIINNYQGKIPSDISKLKRLPGIGKYISNAILCFGYNKKVPIVDTNVIRIYQRVFGLKSDKTRPRTDDEVWKFAEKMLPENNYVKFNYALVDFGAEICKNDNPKCNECPISEICVYYENEVKENESKSN